MESNDGNKKEEETSGEEPVRFTPQRPNRIWAERNLEKWPAIWQPARANTKKPEVRYVAREIQLANGKKVDAKVKVGFTDEGVLTTEDQKTYYALVKQWQEKDCPTAQVPFSVRKLAKLLQKNGWGTNVIDSISHSLRRLRVTPFTWINSYRDAATGEVLEEVELFNILSELKIIRRKADGHITYEGGYYRFNDFTVRNLFERHTKPVLFDVILKFESDIAQLIYTHVDLMLYDKRQYERRTKELFADLGLTGVAYKHASNRKQKLLSALKELRGVRLTSGWISTANIERTADRKDYKVVFRKSTGAHHLAANPEPEVVPVAPPVFADTRPEAITSAAADLVRVFYKTFHSVESHSPQSKELSQATSLIAACGTEQATYVVEFSKVAAEQTRYKPQTFGGILQYTSRAIAHFEKQRLVERQRRQAHVDETERRGKEERKELERNRLLESLAAADYLKRFEQAKRELLAQSPWLVSNEDSALTQLMIKASMIKRIELEKGHVPDPMIAPPDSLVSPHLLLPPPSGLDSNF